MDGQTEGEAQYRTVGDHEVVVVHRQQQDPSYYFDYNALVLNETWFLLLIGGASSRKVLDAIADDIDQLLLQAEFTLPEESP
ncbi:MAG: hypothetical protein IPM16_10915 [Chloroflexi bacterium]|nr:hypothetical protein [Chloroflexota bacterium]